LNTIFSLWDIIQTRLFPVIEEENQTELTAKEKQFVEVVSLMDMGRHMRAYSWCGTGRKKSRRDKILKAFIAKAVYDFPTTRTLLEYLNTSRSLRRLCGWERASEMPSEATFSRAFGEFAEGRLSEMIFEAMVKEHLGDKLVGHISGDSTAIEAREKAVRKVKEEKKPKKRGRPFKGSEPAIEPRRLDLQLTRDLEDNLKDLPISCDFGCKRDSKGNTYSWQGFKLHIGVADGDIPVSAILTSASLHDSQAAIPLLQMTKERIINCYDLYDAAYDAPQIKDFSRNLGHVPIIDSNPRRGEKTLFDPAEKIRFAHRSSVERVNSDLKDNHGGNHIRVRGHSKVMCHLMLGLLVITASNLFSMLC
jgi:transposase